MSDDAVEVEVELSDTLAVGGRDDRGSGGRGGARVPDRASAGAARRGLAGSVPANEQLVALVLSVVSHSDDRSSRTSAVVDQLERNGHHSTYSDVLWALRVGEYRGQLTSAPASANSANSGPCFSLVGGRNQEQETRKP